MQIKKRIETTSLTFVVGDYVANFQDELLLQDLLLSLQDIKFINKNKPYNEIISKQQQHQNYVLVDFEINQYDEYRFILRCVINFLIFTNQHQSFILDTIAFVINDNEEIILDTTDSLKFRLSNDCFFSPSIRAKWKNPFKIEKLLKK